MKINSLKIANFLAIESLFMDLSGTPIHLIVGPNEAGKSSIRDALACALTGQARGLKKHEDQAAFIRNCAKVAEVEIFLADGQVISWRKTPKSAASRIGPVPDDQAMAAILCDPLTFLSMDEKARREMLFRVLPGLNPTAETIYSKLQMSSYDLGSNAPIELAKLAATKGFKAAETEAVTRRREAKRVKESLAVDEPREVAEISAKTYTLPDIQIKDVEDGITSLRQARDKLMKQRGKLEGKTEGLPVLEEELATLAIPDKPEEGAAQKHEAKVTKAESLLKQAKAARDAVEQGSPVQNFPEVCPVHKVPCPVSGNEAVAAVPASDPKKVGKLNALVTEWTAHLDRMQTALREARQAQATYDEALKKKTDLETRIAAFKNQETQAASLNELNEKITALDARINTGEALRDAVREFWQKKGAADAAAAKLKVIDDEIALYHALAHVLAPDGIPSQMIAEALGPVNELLALASNHLFPGRSLTLTKDLDIELAGSPYATLSKSAKFRVGVTLQYALAKLAGARLLMIDEADILDPDNRAQLINFLLAIRPDFDTILCFATSDHADPSPMPELQVWWIEGGRVAPVVAREAA